MKRLEIDPDNIKVVSENGDYIGLTHNDSIGAEVFAALSEYVAALETTALDYINLHEKNGAKLDIPQSVREGALRRAISFLEER